MKKLLSYVRRCVDDYQMISPGDRIAVGVSGGKDSMALLAALAELRAFYPIPFTLEAITLDLGLEGMDFSPVAAYCKEREIPYTVVRTEISHIIFDLRKEKNPCSMCAKMRRGALHNAMLERGLTKIALGHHFDDAVETFFLSLLHEGRLSCFQPVTDLDRTGIVQIRPLLYCGEGFVANTVERLGLPVVHNTCPVDGSTQRQKMKELISVLSQDYPRVKDYVFRAMQALPLPEWAPKRTRRTPRPEGQDQTGGRF